MSIPGTSELDKSLAVAGLTIRNRVFLAPMSGITDDAMRRRAFGFGAGLVVSEMIASGELARDRRFSALRAKRGEVSPHVVQLAGRDPALMAEAARIAEGEGADIIDINMGCPAKKVTGGLSGSALMREPDLALALIGAVIAAVRVPVTVKMRLGWDQTALNAPDLARRAEEAGVAMVTVHGRTRCQFYQGRADWRAIRRVKEAVTIPVVANGDVTSVAEARAILAQSGADAVMIGRAAQGAPWLPGLIVASGGDAAQHPFASPEALADFIVGHHGDMLSLYGRESGLRQARKHLGWYLDRHAPATTREARTAILTADDPESIAEGLRDALLRAVDPRQRVAA